MDSIKALLIGGLIFNLLVVILIPVISFRQHRRVRARGALRRRQILEQGKVIIDQNRLLESSEELVNEQREIINIYRDQE